MTKEEKDYIEFLVEEKWKQLCNLEVALLNKTVKHLEKRIFNLERRFDNLKATTYQRNLRKKKENL